MDDVEVSRVVVAGLHVSPEAKRLLRTAGFRTMNDLLSVRDDISKYWFNVSSLY